MNPFLHPPEGRILPRSLAVAVLLLTALPCAAYGADPANSLQSLEQKLDETRKRGQEMDRRASEAESRLAGLRRRSIAIAAGIQEHEETILTLEDRLSTMDDLRQTKQASLKARHAQLAVMLAALERIALHPPVALIALPMAPADTVRSALLLRGTVPAVQALGHTLRDDIDALTEISRAVRAARDKIEAERANLVKQRAILAKLTTQKTEVARTARRALHDLQEQAGRLGKEAHDLRDLVARLAKRSAADKRKVARPKPDLPAPDKGSGQLAHAADGLPVRGRIARRFGERNEFGQPLRGVVIDTKPDSTVVAPRAGEVVFAGPFRGLGNLLIIEYHAKYHLLLGGLARIDTQVGENVLAGEPVGVMQSAEDQGTSLYMELRRNGQPINPLPWLAAGRTRVNG